METLNFVLLTCFSLLTLIIVIHGQSDEKKILPHSNTAKINEMKGSADVPRVKVKVFRGPSEESDGEQFVTWGFWIKQPAGIKSRHSIPFNV